MTKYLSLTMKSVKYALRDIVRRIWHICFPYTGLDGLDKKLIAYLPQGVGYFIEAGANDGVRQSNTHYLENVKIIDLDLMSLVADQSAGLIDIEKHVQLAEEVQQIAAAEIMVLGITLSELLEQQGNPKVTLFSLDVEGFEFDVLKGLNLSRHRPDFIVVETRGIDDVTHVLSSHYDLIATLSHHDYLFRSKTI